MWPAEACLKKQYEPELDPLFTQAWHILASDLEDLLAERRLSDALKCLAQHIPTTSPDDLLALLCHIMHTAYLKRREAALVLPEMVALFKRLAPTASATSFLALWRMVRKLRWHEAFDEAKTLIDHYLTVQDRLTRDQTAILELERCGALLDEGSYDEAWPYLARLFNTHPQLPDVCYLLTSLSRLGIGDKALNHQAEAQLQKHTSAAKRIFSPNDQPAQMAQHLKHFGFVFVRDLLKPEESSSLLSEANQERPLQKEEVLQLERVMARDPLHYILNAQLGEHMLFHESYFKINCGQGAVAWHQDGRTTNDVRDYVTCWTPFTPCGREAPALEVVTARFSAFFPLHLPGMIRTGEEKNFYGPYPWGTNEALILPDTVWSPPFEVGDLLLFDKYALHRTQFLTPDQINPNTPRISADFRVYSKTSHR